MDRTLYITALDDTCRVLNALPGGLKVINELLDGLLEQGKIDISEAETLGEAWLGE